jgi:class 3 adenylate cyclase/tetratricopeptide (TPR) repeat protein
MADATAVREWLESANSLEELWQRRFDWIKDANKMRAFVKRAIREGDFLVAHDAAREAIEQHQFKDIWMQQQMALALAQLGSTTRAQAILQSLLEKEPANHETLGLLGRTFKDQWYADPANTAALDSAFKWYRQAFDISPPDYYPGINAAALALLRDDKEGACALASRVLKICEEKLIKANPDELYWLRVTIAEALLILQRPEEASKAYRQATEIENLSTRELSSTRKQARLLSKRLYGRAGLFDECFPLPKLVIFSGHMMDSANRHTPRFPPADEHAVRSIIEEQLRLINAGIGFSSAACGCDIIFLEAMLNRGGTIHVLLPWPKAQFVKTSVEVAAGNWLARFERVLARAASVRVLGELQMPGSPIGLDYCNAAMIGLARLYAHSLDLEFAPVAVWDGRPGAPGGTGSFVRYWRTHKVPVCILSLPSPGNPPGAAQSQSDTFDDSEDDLENWIRASGRHELKAIMFADVAGYTKLTEVLMPTFLAKFNQQISRLIAESAYPPVNVNTWGDAFFFAFNLVEHAGRFALDLRDLIKRTRWTEFGLPEDISIRIAVHAGPVYVGFDPVSRQPTFAGAHVVRAARIEPVTHEGEVFASEEFAALAAAEEVTSFKCDFVGTTQLPKRYGSFRIYSLARAEKQQP